MRRATAVLVLAAAVLVLGGPGVGAASGRGVSGSFLKVRVAPGMAVYEWHNSGDLAPAEVDRRLRFLRANGFRTVYLETGRDLDAADAHQPLAAIRGQIRRFVAAATRRGIAVQALGGGDDWVGERRYLGQLLVTIVGDYNARVAANERLQGVHLDLEPYAKPGWLDHPQENFDEYLTTIAGIVDSYRSVLTRHHSRHLQLGFAVPFWFDARGDAPGPVAFDGATKPAVHHLIDLIGDLPGAYLVVMAYRDFTGTSDGSIAHARDEFRYAAATWARCGLVVGQQYGPAGPDEQHITFNGQPRSDFLRAAAAITTAFRRYPQFRGLSVDDLDAYMAAGP